MSLGTFVCVSIPNQLKQLGRESIGDITLTPAPSVNRFLLSRALELVATEDNCKNYLKLAGGANGVKLRDGSVLREAGYIINSSDCLWQVIFYFVHITDN